MKKPRLIFFVIFGVFQVIFFLFTLYVDQQKNNIQFLIAMQSKIWLFKYASSAGLVLFIVDLIWHLREDRDGKKEKEKQGQELNILKAKMFDLQEKQSGQKPSPAPNAPETSGQP